MKGLQRQLKKKDECIAKMRLRLRGLESGLVTTKPSFDELMLKS